MSHTRGCYRQRVGQRVLVGESLGRLRGRVRVDYRFVTTANLIDDCGLAAAASECSLQMRSISPTANGVG
jgi:hypothetical protein